MRKCFKLRSSFRLKFYLPFFLIALFPFTSSLSVQSGIPGTVTDADSLPLQWMTVNVAIFQLGIQNHQSSGLQTTFKPVCKDKTI